MSLEAAAALICRLGWRMELLQSRARANVPTALKQTDTGYYHSDQSVLHLQLGNITTVYELVCVMLNVY